MQTEPKAIGLMILCTFLTSTAQVLYKFGANKLVLTFTGLITNYQLILGLFLYIVAGAILIIALKGGELTVLYPIVATSYVWVALMSVYFFGEAMNIFKWIGVLVIIGGVAFVSAGSEKDSIGYTEVP